MFCLELTPPPTALQNSQVLIGGGQEASQVTTTSSRAGKFEARFFHKIFCDEFANVKGHFGPINAGGCGMVEWGDTGGGGWGALRRRHEGRMLGGIDCALQSPARL